MSNDLRGLFKKELDQIPLRPVETWVPRDRPHPLFGTFAWRTTIAIVVLAAAIIGGGQLASFRAQNAAAPGVVAGMAIYLSPSFNGSGWIQIDPDSLKDLSTTALLDIPSSTQNSSQTQVSADGSTIIVSDFSPSSVTRHVYDGRTGQLRGLLVPQVPMVIDYLSADGTSGLGRIGDNRNPLTAESVIIAIADGRVLRRLPSIDVPGEIQAAPVSPDLSTRYFITTPAPLSLNSAVSQSLPYSLFVRSWTDALSGPIPLPGITAGTTLRGPAGTPITVRPAIALSRDGSRLAALSADGSTLDLVDTKTLAVTTLTVRKKTSFLDFLQPLIAEAKTINDDERRSVAFNPDGTALISWMTATHYDELNPPFRTTRGIQRIDVATGLITAESAAPDGIYDFLMAPDGQSVYFIVRAKEPPTPLYVLRRVDARTLEPKADRILDDYAELELVAAPARSPVRESISSATACPVTATRDASGVITSPGSDLGLIEIRPATFPGEKVIVLVRGGGQPYTTLDTLAIRAEPVPRNGTTVEWSTQATPRTTAWGSIVFEIDTKPLGNAGCWWLIRNDGPGNDPGIVVDLGR